MKRSAICAIFDPQGNFLVLRRSKTDPWKPYHWNFPGGGIEDWESPRQGAVREVREEAGILLPARALRYLFSFRPKPRHTVYVFSFQVEQQLPVQYVDQEHDLHIWTSLNQLPAPAIPGFNSLVRQVALRLFANPSSIREGSRGEQRMYNTSKYMAHWPLAVPYPYALTRSQGPVPNASSIDWPQAQFAPPYLPPGSPSFQPYRYKQKPRRYPPGALVFSTKKGPWTLPFSTKPMSRALRRRLAQQPDGDIIRVPPPFGVHAQRNPSGGIQINLPTNGGSSSSGSWEANLAPDCRAVYSHAIRTAEAEKARRESPAAWDQMRVDFLIRKMNEKGFDIPRSYTYAQIGSSKTYKDFLKKESRRERSRRHSELTLMEQYYQAANEKWVAAATEAAQMEALACQARAKQAHEEAEYEMLREQKVQMQETAEEQALRESNLALMEEEATATAARNQMILWGTLGVLTLGTAALVVTSWRRRQ